MHWSSWQFGADFTIPTDLATVTVPTPMATTMTRSLMVSKCQYPIATTIYIQIYLLYIYYFITTQLRVFLSVVSSHPPTHTLPFTSTTTTKPLDKFNLVPFYCYSLHHYNAIVTVSFLWLPPTHPPNGVGRHPLLSACIAFNQLHNSLNFKILIESRLSSTSLLGGVDSTRVGMSSEWLEYLHTLVLVARTIERRHARPDRVCAEMAIQCLGNFACHSQATFLLSHTLRTTNLCWTSVDPWGRSGLKTSSTTSWSAR